jgi:hypothetical protein
MVDLFSGRTEWSRDLRQSHVKEWAEGTWEPEILVASGGIILRKADQLLMLDQTGAIRWRHSLMGEAGRGPAILQGDHLFVSLSRTELAAIHVPDGKIAWKASVPWPSWGLPIWIESNGRLGVLLDHYEWQGIDPAKGPSRFRAIVTKIPVRNVEGCFATSGEVFISANSFGLDCRSLVDGRLLWHRDLAGVRSIHACRGRLFVFGQAEAGPTVKEVKISDGTTLSELAIPFAGEVKEIEWNKYGALVRMDQQTVGLAW